MGTFETGGEPSYVWRNGTRVVQIFYEVPDGGEDILRRYLEKYPPDK